MKSSMKWINVGLRGIMEAGIVLAFGFWGYHIMADKGWKIVLAVGTPLIGFGIWGLVDFHRSGILAEPLRLLQELLISGLAAVALYSAGAHIMGWALGILSIIHHTLNYLLGERLVKASTDR